MMDEIEMIQLENMMGYFEKEPKNAAKYLEEAKNLHKDYIANGGAFVEDNYNDMKAYALDNFKRFDKIVKGEVKRLPAACKKTAEFKAAYATYKAAMAELLDAIEAFEIEEEVEEMESIEEVVTTTSSEDDWHEPTAEELKKADQDAALDDAYAAAYEELDDLKVKTVEAVWEYEYGGRKSDDEQLSKLKETLNELEAALNEIENVMYRYNKGWMEYWDADHAIFMAMSEF